MSPTLIQIRTELLRLGWGESHERVRAFLTRCGVTCLEALPQQRQETLLKKLKELDAPDDMIELTTKLSVLCDYKGLSLDGFWMKLWLNQNAVESRHYLTPQELTRLIEDLDGCKSEGYTIPIKRELAEMRSIMAEIVDILQAGQPQSQRIANLKVKIASSPYDSARSSL